MFHTEQCISTHTSLKRYNMVGLTWHCAQMLHHSCRCFHVRKQRCGLSTGNGASHGVKALLAIYFGWLTSSWYMCTIWTPRKKRWRLIVTPAFGNYTILMLELIPGNLRRTTCVLFHPVHPPCQLLPFDSCFLSNSSVSPDETFKLLVIWEHRRSPPATAAIYLEPDLEGNLRATATLWV